MISLRAPSCAQDVLSHYRSRLNELQNQIAVARRERNRAIATIGAVILLAVLASVATLRHDPQAAWALMGPAALVAVFYRSFARAQVGLTELAIRTNFYDRAIDRVTGKWRGQGDTGAAFTRANHAYEKDLMILGEGSLFELVCTTRSDAGAEKLAAFLLDPPQRDEARARQEAVKELLAHTELREEIALLGKYQFQNCDAAKLRAWAVQPILRLPRTVPVFLFLSSVVCVVLYFCGFAGLLPWLHLLPFLAPLVAAQAIIALRLSSRIRTRLAEVRSLFGDFTLLQHGLALLERQSFKGGRLQELTDRLGGGASKRIASLERLRFLMAGSEDPLVYGFSLWVGLGSQLVLAMERWRAVYQSEMLQWLDAWAEFDALNALAGYAFEHPADCFPQLIDGGPRFETTALGHPMLADEQCVRNDVVLDDSTAFYMISGSNMSGKSTLLRTIGTNAVLAAAGAPVRAATARMNVFNICASIAIVDSMGEGKSKFLAEVERLREAVRMTAQDQPVLFLIDEILSGTNSRDRRSAAASIMESLVKRGAVGALSTHDLSLTEIADTPGLKGVNVHMESGSPDAPLDFDYRLKPGILQGSNALAIVRMVMSGEPD